MYIRNKVLVNDKIAFGDNIRGEKWIASVRARDKKFGMEIRSCIDIKYTENEKDAMIFSKTGLAIFYKMIENSDIKFQTIVPYNGDEFVGHFIIPVHVKDDYAKYLNIYNIEHDIFTKEVNCKSNANIIYKDEYHGFILHYITSVFGYKRNDMIYDVMHKEYVLVNNAGKFLTGFQCIDGLLIYGSDIYTDNIDDAYKFKKLNDVVLLASQIKDSNIRATI